MVALGDPRLADPFDRRLRRKWTWPLGGRAQLGLRLRRGSARRHPLHVHAARRSTCPGRRACSTTHASFAFDTGGPAIRNSAASPRQHDRRGPDIPARARLASNDTNRSNAPPIARSTASPNGCRCACSPATSARRSSINAANSATATTRSCGKTAADRTRACATVRSKPPEAQTSGARLQAHPAACHETANRLGAPASLHQPASQPRSDQKLALRSTSGVCRESAMQSRQCPRRLYSARSRFDCSSARRSPVGSAATTRIVMADGATLAPEPVAAGVASVEDLTFKPPFPDDQLFTCSCRGPSSTMSADRFPTQTVFRSKSKSTNTRRSQNSPDSSAFWKPTKARCCRLRCATSKSSCPRNAQRSRVSAYGSHPMLRASRNGCSVSTSANASRGSWTYDEAEKKSVWTEQTADRSVFEATDATQPFAIPVVDVEPNANRCDRSKSLGFHCRNAASMS